ncbi:ribosome recycling factor [Candidatus Carsonella ruddii]|uniref:ribosome recycling factor n=1 Tax=Carsonella ruddii TaxID=114186 RepID=UPI00247A5409|nr:ribosome recycling factor [Candidatus Carsonella ruddii]WGS66886.1 ribosome recycling factor [Candidatus Carsonella ruddii]
MLTFITNKILIFEKILKEFNDSFKNFNIKNLGLETLNNLKLKMEKKNIFLKDICIIKKIEEKIFSLHFHDLNQFKKIVKNNFFENFGFQITKKKLNLELKIPNLSLEFRNNILKILKEEYYYYKEIIENNRKKIFFEIKNNFKSKNDINYIEKNIDKEILNTKKKLKEIFEKKSFKILND